MSSISVPMHELQRGIFINLAAVTVVQVCEKPESSRNNQVGCFSLNDDRGECWLNADEMDRLLRALGLPTREAIWAAGGQVVMSPAEPGKKENE